ncbi:hypothetical protein V6N12_029388 [Hibiscus sabdariffa]|uniref:BHLH domain-containing protein n=1 Tax=Hibiscus sabdariffa TaxID=183260 RepID=A0ABR2CVZ2_9ROSI
MAAYSSFNNSFSFENCYSGFLDPLWRDRGPCDGISHGGSLPVAAPSQSLVLDSEKGELVKTPVKAGKTTVSEEKVMAALKSHSEAERRRRERINAHLDTLRTLLPCKDKMDKATLLGEVVRQVKQLKKNATEASKGFLVPMDDDEIRVDACDDDDNDEANGTYCFKASICCDYRPQLLADLRRALDALPIKMVKAEISTLGSRVRNEFVLTGCRTSRADDSEARQYLARSIRQAMDSVKENASILPEHSPDSAFPKKRQRISYFDSSSSSS